MAFSGRRRWLGIGWITCCACACANGATRAGDAVPNDPRSAPQPAFAPTIASLGSAPGGAAGVAAPSEIVGKVDGQPIYASDAFRLVQLSAPAEAGNAVRQLAIDRLAAAEAGASGATVPAAIVDRELARLLADQERKIREASGGKRDLVAFVKSTFGLDPPAYFALVRGSLERSLLLERVVLFELARHPRTQVRLIRVKDKALAQEIRDKIAKGADFAALARQHSEDGSARDGGVYPPLPNDLPSPLFEKSGDLAAGAVSEVEEVSTPDGPRYRIVQVLARLGAESGSYPQRAAELEKLLDGRPLAPLELEVWQMIMQERHQVELSGLSGPHGSAGTGSDNDGA